MSLLVVDGNNYARIVFETDATGYAIRRLYQDIAFNGRPTIVVFDGKNAKAKRREIFPGYKVGRNPAPDQFYRILDFWKEILMHTHALQICVDGFEGDDVINYLVKTSPRVPIEIESSDGDFCALHSEHVTQPRAPALKEVAAEDIRLYKAMVGDKTDKIPGIKNFGPGYWEKLTKTDKTNIIQFLEGDQLWANHLSRESHNQWVWNNQQLFRSFWQVAGFLEISSDEIFSSIRSGVPAPLIAEKKLEDIQQPSQAREIFNSFSAAFQKS